MPLAEFRRTKTYDLLAAAPLILWYGLGVYGQLPNLLNEHVGRAVTAENLRNLLHVLALASSFAFLGLLVILLLLRPPPEARAQGLPPRITAFIHAFLGATYAWIPAADLSLPMTMLSWLLSTCGAIASIYVAFWLGRAFSIMPEARKLVTSGPYARIRHPLYLAEMIGSLGVMLQFRQPWSGLLFIAAVPLLVMRMGFEEEVLANRFPEYRDYVKRTARILPGIY